MGLACSTGEAERSGSTAPIDCANRGAELRRVASSASKGRLLGRTGSLARARARVLRSLGIRRSASPAEGWSGIGAVVLTVHAAADGRIVSAVSQRVSAVSKGQRFTASRHPFALQNLQDNWCGTVGRNTATSHAWRGHRFA